VRMRLSPKGRGRKEILGSKNAKTRRESKATERLMLREVPNSIVACGRKIETERGELCGNEISLGAFSKGGVSHTRSRLKEERGMLRSREGGIGTPWRTAAQM